jgi:hypothetical protein
MNQSQWAAQQAAQAAMQRSQQEAQRQQQRHRMQDQQQQLQWLQQQRQQRLWAQQQRLAGADAGGEPVSRPATSAPRPYRPRLRGRRLLRLAIVIALLMGAVALVANAANSDSKLGGPFGARGGVTATPTAALNVRSGPSSGTAILGTVQPGEELRLACQDGGWDRLRSPFGGAYVYDGYVQRSGPLQPCE